jgi:hypothetical protein
MADVPLTESDEVTIADAAGTNKLAVNAAGAASVILPKSSTATITRVATSGTAVTLLAANANRKKVIIMTESGTSNYVAYGSTATVTNYTIMVGANATIEDEIWTGSISLIRSSGTGFVQVTEIV